MTGDDATGAPNPGGGRRAALIRFGLRSLTALFFLLAAGVLLGQHLRTLDWPATLGTVERMVIARAGDAADSRAPGERFQPAVSYRYEVDGTTYEATQIAVFDWIYPTRAGAERYMRRFGIETGARVPVYVNPEDPEESILIRHLPLRRLEVILAILFLVVLPLSVVVFSLLDVMRGGGHRGDDRSRGRFW